MKRREFLDVTVQASLGTSLFGISSSLWAGEVQWMIHGRVTGQGKPLGDVLVSDGCRVVRTNAQGNYELVVGPDSGQFVFVTTPRGWWAERFYVPLSHAVKADRADFELYPIDQPPRFNFVFAADLGSLDNPRQQAGRDKTEASIREICGLAPKPAFLWIQGDLGIVGDGGRFLTKCLKTSTIPVRVGIGNHEVMSKSPSPKELYESLFGPTYYSFDWGRVHFVVLDGNRPDVKSCGSSRGVVEGAELAWLKADLASQPKGKPIIVGVHIPIVSTYPARRPDLKEEEAPFWISATQPAITALLSKHKVRLVLAGHEHENERTIVDGVEYVTSVSLCGCWWQSGRDFERATDGSPRGYRVVSVDGNKITHHYRSSCESYVDRQGEFVGLADRMKADKDVVFVFNCYDAPNESRAETRIDGGPWQKMDALCVGSPPVERPHHFRTMLPQGNMSVGRHTVEVRVIWPDGTVVAQKKTVDVLQ